MPATLNQDDIKLLKSVFPTKEDLKSEIEALAARIIEPRIGKLENIVGISATN